MITPQPRTGAANQHQTMKDMTGVTNKWDRATRADTRRRAKRSSAWVSYGQLYREISGGYLHFLATRTRNGALKKEART